MRVRPAGAPAAPGSGVAGRVHLALLVVQASFSGFHVFGKVVLEAIDPLALAAMRILFAVPLLFWLASRYGSIAVPRRCLPRLALLGVLGVLANQVLFVVGLKFTTATNAAILMPSIPVFAAAVGALLGIDRVGPRRILGIALAVGGALVLLDPFNLDFGGGAALGNALILVNCLSYGAFLVLQRPLLQALPWRTVLAWAFLFGGIGTLLLGGGPLLAVDAAAVPPVAWWGVVYILLFPTALGYSLNTWAVRRSSPTLVATYTTLQPLLTALLAVPLLGEAFGWREAAGLVLIAGGLWRVTYRPAESAAV